MFVRLTYLSFLPGKFNASKHLYNDEILPEIKKQQGNIDAMMLEPVNNTDDYISITLWESKEAAEEYHNSGKYRSLVNQIKGAFSKEPVLKVYSTEHILEHT